MIRSELRSSWMMIALVFCLLMPFSQRGRANDSDTGWSGNGGDLLLQADNPWNLGDEEVRYCVSSAPGFPIAEGRLREIVAQSIRDWQTFFGKYHLADATFSGPRPGLDAAIMFPDGKARGLALNFSEVPCPASEDRNLIYFLFGVENSPVKRFLASSSDGSLGVALRREYNYETFRNGGYVWFAPFSSDENRVRHLVLHEIGHTLGMPHDSVFVMDTYIATALSNPNFESSDFGLIESDFWTYRLRPGDELVLSSRLGRKVLRPARLGAIAECLRRDLQPNAKLPPFLLRVLQLPPRGCHSITLRAGELLPPPMRRHRAYTLILQDAQSGRAFPLSGHLEPAQMLPRENPSPGLFALFSLPTPTGTQKRFLRSLLDTEPPTVPARGSFALDGKEIAARLVLERGIQLELFLGHKEGWWSLRSE